MARKRLHSSGSIWALAQRQHGVVTRRQLLELDYSRDAIAHRLARGRLHRVHAGVYAVGRPDLTAHGRWMAAVLACGPKAALSHQAAAQLLGIRPGRHAIEVSVPRSSRPKVPRVVIHRRSRLDTIHHDDIPATCPALTLVDLATRLRKDALEAAVKEADTLGLVDPETLRNELERYAGMPGAAPLRAALDRRTFRLTASTLERRFLAIVRRAGLPSPETGRRVNGFEVDFYWPSLGLVIETDGLRYHRTAAQQARDRLRDQAHAVSGLTTLRFTHAQVALERDRVEATVAAVAARLAGRQDGG